MFDVLGLLVTVVLFVGFVLLTLVLEAGRWLYRLLTENLPSA
jgi:hypothetical protein